MKRPLRGSIVLATLCGLLLQCSMIVSSSLENVRCTEPGQVGPPACEAGWFCGMGRCRPCQSGESCGDRMDNDCNGRVDDGCPTDGGTTD